MSHSPPAIAALLLCCLLVAACSTNVAPTPSSRTARDFECAAEAPDFPEFDGQQIDLLTLRDRTGLVTGCRRMRSDVSAGIREAIGPPLEVMTDTSLEISSANRAGNLLLVMWIQLNCDEAAHVEFSQPFHYRLAVNQQRSGPCGPGTGLVAIELEFARSVMPEAIEGSIQRQVTGP